LHDEITADYTDMIHAGTPEDIEKRRKAFIRKWWLSTARWPAAGAADIMSGASASSRFCYEVGRSPSFFLSSALVRIVSNQRISVSILNSCSILSRPTLAN
jgi:hypothetical protein